MNAVEELHEGGRLLDAANIDMKQMSPAVISVHPELSGKPDRIRLVLAAAAYTLDQTAGVRDVDGVARHLADRGAFSWDGPVGNGMTVDEYRKRFRDIAEPIVFFGRLMGMTESTR